MRVDTPASAGRPRRVLLVSDEPKQAGTVRALLDRAMECDVIEAAGTEAMLACLDDAVIDVILLDLAASDMSRDDLLKGLGDRVRQIPVVVLAATDDEQTATAYLDAGAQDHLLRHQLEPHNLRRAIGYAITRVREKLQRERHAAELGEYTAQIEAQEARLRTIIEVAPHGMLIVDSAGRIRLVNRAIERLFGHARTELIGETVDMLLAPHLRAGHAAMMQRFFANPQERAMGGGREFSGSHKDGRAIALEIGLSPIHADGELRTLATIVDVTARKRARERLERSNRDLADFAKVASHDMQEPLRKVTAFSSRLLEELQGTLSDKAQFYLDRITDAVDRMGDMIRDLLAYSRLDSRERVLARVDLATTFAQVRSDLEYTIQQAGASVEIGEMPTIEADGAQLRQLFLNLLSNALKFTRPNVAPIVRVTCTEVENQMGATPPLRTYRISVADNGIGFDERHLERIFTIFKRLHGRGTYEGTGIGLAICRRIVERHGGRITASSQPGEGATFIITIPELQPREEDDAVPTARA